MKLILILIVSILFNYSYSYEIEKLNETKFLKFEKNKLTTGDKNGNNKFNQLICYGNMDLCYQQEINLIICNNLNYNKTYLEPNWNCLTALKDDIFFNQTSINCEHNDISNSNEIIQGSCYFHYQFIKNQTDCLLPIALTFNFTFIGTILLYVSIFCCLRKRYINLLNQSIKSSSESNLTENSSKKKSNC